MKYVPELFAGLPTPASMIEEIAQQNFDLQEAVDEVEEEMEESLPTVHWATQPPKRYFLDNFFVNSSQTSFFA